MERINRYLSTINPVYSSLSFLSDLSVGNYNFPFLCEVFFTLYGVINTILAVYTPLYACNHLFTDEQRNSLINFRSKITPTQGSDLSNLLTDHTFYIRFIIFVYSFLLYASFILYYHSKYLGQFWQIVMFIGSTVLGPFFAWWTLVDFLNCLFIFIDTKDTYALVNLIFGLISIPIYILYAIKATVDMRIRPHTVASLNSSQTFNWVMLIYVLAIIQELIVHSPESTAFPYLGLFVDFVLSTYMTINSCRFRHFSNLYVHVSTNIGTACCMTSSFLGFIFMQARFSDFNAQLILHIVFAVVAAVAVTVYILKRRANSKIRLKNYDIIHPNEVSLSEFIYCISEADTDKDQRRFPISLFDEIESTFHHNIEILILFMAFKVVKNEHYNIIHRKSQELIKLNSLAFLSVVRLKGIASIASGHNLYIDGFYFLNMKKVNQLLSPLYQDIRLFWKSALIGDVGAIRVTMIHFASNAKRFKYFFKNSPELNEVYEKTVSFEIANYEPDDNITEDMIQRAKNVRMYHPKVFERLVSMHNWVIFIIFVFCIGQSILDLGFSFEGVDIPSVIDKGVEAEQYIINVITAYNEYTFGPRLNITRTLLPQDCTREDFFEYVYSQVIAFQENPLFAQYFDEENLSDYLSSMIYATDEEPVFNDPTSNYTKFVKELAIKSLYFTEVLGEITQYIRDQSDVSKSHQLFIFSITSIAGAVIFVILEIFEFFVLKNGTKQINQICWQPILLEKEEILYMMNRYSQLKDSMGLHKEEITNPFRRADNTAIFTMTLFLIPLSIVSSFLSYVVTTNEADLMYRATYYTPITPHLFATLNLLASVAADTSDLTTYTYLNVSTNYLLEIASIMEHANFSLNQHSKDNFIDQEFIDTYTYNFPHVSDAIGTEFLRMIDVEERSNLQNYLVALAIRVQSLVASRSDTPYMIIGSSISAAMDVSNRIAAFNQEIINVIDEKWQTDTLQKILYFAIFSLISIGVCYILYDTVHTIFTGITISLRMIAYAPNSPFFAPDGFNDLQPPPSSKTENLIETIPAGLIFYNHDGIITKINPEATEMYGHDLLGQKTSILKRVVTQEDGTKRTYQLKKYAASQFPSNFFDPKNEYHFIIATDFTSLLETKEKVKAMNNDVKRDFSIPAVLQYNTVYPMKQAALVEVLIDSSSQDSDFASFTPIFNERAEASITIFHIDTQRWSCFAIFYSNEDKQRKLQFSESIKFSLEIIQYMAKCNVKGSIGVSAITLMHATIPNRNIPKINFKSETLFKSAVLTKFAQLGQIAVEKKLLKYVNENLVNVIKDETIVYCNEEIRYNVIVPTAESKI